MVVMAGCGSSSRTPPGLNISGPGLQTGQPAQGPSQAPWQPEYAHLAERLNLIGIPAGGKEKFHIHAQLRIYVDGLLKPLPADIGVKAAKGIESSMHTHDRSGIIHMEAPHPYNYTLGEFFSVWGVKLGPAQVGGLKGYGGDLLPQRQSAERPGRARAAQGRQGGDRIWAAQRLSAHPEQVPPERGGQRGRRARLRRHKEGTEGEKLPCAEAG